MSKYLKWNSLLSIFLIFLGTSALAFSTINQEEFDVFYYEINIAIDPQSEILDGLVTVKAISLTDNLSQITLDLFNNMKVTAIVGNASTFKHENNLLTINLDRDYHKNEPISITISYNGHPSSGTSFNPMTFNRSRSVVTISSESCPYYARCWWPCKDRPDDKADSMDIKITIPSDLIVASNGALIEVIDNKNGTNTHHWQVRNPIATYLVSFTISNYKMIQDKYVNPSQDTLAIMHFLYPEHYNKALVDFNNLNQMIQILETYYGPYPYYNEKYGIAEYVGYWGGMEYQTLSSLQPYLITGNHTYDDVFVHELAHQWWGDCVTPKDFHHSWISEGFATFTEALYFGYLEGQDRYHSYMNNENNALSSKGIMYRHDISNPDNVYALIVYYKGAWVLHMLRHVVGEDKFWAGLQEFRSHFEYGSATTEDLQHAFETTTGDSLGWFFHQWVYEPNYPVYTYGWHQEKNYEGQYKLYIFINQTQTDAPLFKMPVDLTITTTALETTFVMMVDNSLEKFQYSSFDSIINVQLDKNDWVLKKANVITTPILEYVDHQISDSTGNNNGLAEPGETVKILIRITNKGVLARHITGSLKSSDPDIHIPADVIVYDFSGIKYDELSNDLDFPFSFSVASGAVGHLATFELHLTADITYNVVDSFDVKIGTPNILLVDDDNGAKYERYFTQPMSLAKIYSDTWEVTTQGCPTYSDVLQKYHTVIWFTGDDRTTSLTQAEQQVIAEFLDHSGWLVLTGQDIGFDLITDGTPEDSAFFKNYLHADLLADTVNSTKLIGVAGDPIGNSLFIYIEKKEGSAGNQQSPSAIVPQDGAVTFLKYIPPMSSGGIRYIDETKGYRMVYLAFGYEGISGPYQDSAQKLLNRMLNWLGGTTAVKKLETKPIPSEYKLEQNYPNPFNPMTRIRYYLPQPEKVELSIYNLNGQKIKTLVDQKQAAGAYELAWDGADSAGLPVASGIYVYRLVTGSISRSKKLLLIK